MIYVEGGPAGVALIKFCVSRPDLRSERRLFASGPSAAEKKLMKNKSKSKRSAVGRASLFLLLCPYRKQSKKKTKRRPLRFA
jgi:hypothetical protein